MPSRPCFCFVCPHRHSIALIYPTLSVRRIICQGPYHASVYVQVLGDFEESVLYYTTSILTSMVFSRDYFMRKLSSYYEFLVDQSLPRSVLRSPPPREWPPFTNELLATINKDETVMDLVRYLPCLEWHYHDEA